jgi:hypothetical protein
MFERAPQAFGARIGDIDQSCKTHRRVITRFVSLNRLFLKTDSFRKLPLRQPTRDPSPNESRWQLRNSGKNSQPNSAFCAGRPGERPRSAGCSAAARR